MSEQSISVLYLLIVLIGIIRVQILDAVQYVNIKWQVASNQIAASQSESPIMPDTQMRPDEVTDGLITPRHKSSDDHTNKTNFGNEEENHLQINPRLQVVWGDRWAGALAAHRTGTGNWNITLCAQPRDYLIIITWEHEIFVIQSLSELRPRPPSKCRTNIDWSWLL